MCTSDGGSPTSGSIQRPAALTKFVDVSTIVDTSTNLVRAAGRWIEPEVGLPPSEVHMSRLPCTSAMLTMT
ncbi:hypothetical protein GTG23_06645 [Rhodococcus hoagii]|nr:hypothetical protein [Prescottella equi]